VGSAIKIVDMKRLLLESGGICAFPGCRRPLVTADAPDEPGAVIAEVAHIVAESREGPRGSDPLSEEERNQSENLIVVCPEHHKVIDSQPKTYSIAVLRQMKMDHVSGVRRRLHLESTLKTYSLVAENIRSSVQTVTHVPQAVFEAKCAFGPGQEEEVRTRLETPKDREVLFPFALVGGKVYCFQNLRARDNAFAKVIDARTVEARAARKMWEDDDDARLYVRLLNRSLYKYAGHRGIRYDVQHRRFFFVADKKGEARSVEYKSLTGRNVERKVVWQPVRRKTGVASLVWWHVAAGLRFRKVAPLQWCLAIRPEWHLTQDGETPLEAKRIGRRVTSRKSRMFNRQYLREVSFWRDFLAEGKPRMLLNFGDQSAVVDSELLELDVEWPGIPGDEMPFEGRTGEENLFTLAEFQDATEGEGVDWEGEDEEEEDEENEEVEEDGDNEL
jgi:hypothetical protein